MKLAFLSIPKELENNMAGDQAFRLCGNNFGNMVFVNAISDQLIYTDSLYSYKLDPSVINEMYDAVVIPAANWLNSSIDLGGFYNSIKDIKVPCIVIGIGAQSDSYDTIPKLPDGTIKFLDFISNNSALIGARGEFSEKVLHHYGYKTGVAIGCPSLYWNCSEHPPMVASKVYSTDMTTVIQGTRHNIPNDSFYKQGPAVNQRDLIKRARLENLTYIIQSEFEELIYSKSPADCSTDTIKKLEQYYSEKMSNGLSQHLIHNMKVFYNVREWIDYLTNVDFLLTSRIHGSIMGMHSGVPSLLLCHDTRTLEIAEYAGLPHINMSEYVKNKSIDYLYGLTDYTVFNEKYKKNVQKYASFLTTNGLSHKILIK